MLPALSAYLSTKKDYLDQAQEMNPRRNSSEQTNSNHHDPPLPSPSTNPFVSRQEKNVASSPSNPFSEQFHGENERSKDHPSSSSHRILLQKTEDKSPATNPFSKEKADKKAKRNQVPKACTNCRKKKAGCDRTRPCQRCISGGEESSCCDTPRKKRGSNGQLTNSTPSSPSFQAEENSEDDSPTSSSNGFSSSNSNDTGSTGSTGSNGSSNDSGGSSSGDSLRSAHHHNKKHKSNHNGRNPSDSRRDLPDPSPPTSPLPPKSNVALSESSKASNTHNNNNHNIINTSNNTMGIGTKEIRSMVESMSFEVISRLLVYVVDKHGERELVKGAFEATKRGTEGIEMHLIRDYVKSIFEKASKCGDWNIAVAMVVTLVDDGIILLEARQPRSAMLFFTGYLEGLSKNDPWHSCFQQNHQHTADVPFLVDSFCSKLLEFDSVFNDYEKEILKNRLEPFRIRMASNHEGFRRFYGETFSNGNRGPSHDIFAKKLTAINDSHQSHNFNDSPVEPQPSGSPDLCNISLPQPPKEAEKN